MKVLHLDSSCHSAVVSYYYLMKKLALMTLCLVFLTSCATRMNLLKNGMTKDEVIQVLGEPYTTTSPGGGVQVLRYAFYSRGSWTYYEEYFAGIVDGRLAKYGKWGDYNSTKDPTYNLNVNKSELERANFDFWSHAIKSGGVGTVVQPPKAIPQPPKVN